jgi:hypothetical protein
LLALGTALDHTHLYPFANVSGAMNTLGAFIADARRRAEAGPIALK